MAEYDNTNKGVLFENNRKETDRHPDMNGKLNIDGVDHWISGWWNTSKKGTEFLSLALGDEVEEKEEAPKRKSSSRGKSKSGGRSSSSKRGSSSRGKSAKKSEPEVDNSEEEDDDLPF